MSMQTVHRVLQLGKPFAFSQSPGMNFVEVVKASGTLSFVFADGGNVDAVQTDLLEFSQAVPLPQGFSVTSTVDGDEVELRVGMGKSFRLGNAAGGAGTADKIYPTTQLDPSTPFSIPSDGAGTLSFSVTTPATGVLTMTSLDGSNLVRVRDAEGHVYEGQNFPVNTNGTFFIDLEATGGVVFEFFGAPGTFATLYSPRVSALAKPYTWLRRASGPAFPSNGGTPYAGHQIVQSSILKNFGLKTVSFRGKFNGNPVENVIVSFQPVKADGTVYPGRPGFATVRIGKDFHISYDVETGVISYDVDGVGPGPGLSSVLALATGAADLVIQVEGGPNAWGFQDPDTTNTVRA